MPQVILSALYCLMLILQRPCEVPGGNHDLPTVTNDHMTAALPRLSFVGMASGRTGSLIRFGTIRSLFHTLYTSSEVIVDHGNSPIASIALQYAQHPFFFFLSYYLSSISITILQP